MRVTLYIVLSLVLCDTWETVVTGSSRFLHCVHRAPDVCLAPPGPGEDAENRACFSCGTHCTSTHTLHACAQRHGIFGQSRVSHRRPGLHPERLGPRKCRGASPPSGTASALKLTVCSTCPQGEKIMKKNCMVLYQGHEFLSPVPRLSHLSGPTPCRALWVLHRLQVLDGKREERERGCQHRGHLQSLLQYPTLLGATEPKL